MKKKYTFKTIKTGIAVLAILLGFTQVNAQTEIDGNVGVRSDASILKYPDGAATFLSAEITEEGTTFQLQVTVTPSGNANAFIGNQANRRFGVGDSSDGADAGNLIDSDTSDALTFSSISIVNFNDNGTGYTQAAISNLHFRTLSTRGAQAATDNPNITVNGATNSGDFDLGQLTSTSFIVEFGVEFANFAGTLITVGSLDEDITSVTAASAASASGSTYQVLGINVGYKFTTDPALSLNDITKDDQTIIISPSIVESTFTINKSFKTLSVIDITGRTVKIFDATDALNVSNLNPGIYTALIETENGQAATSRFIIK